MDHGHVVASLVLLDLGPLAVMASVQLHDQPAFQQQVHISDAVDVGLGFDPDDARLAEACSGEGLKQGFGSVVHPVQDLAGAAVTLPGEPVPQEAECDLAPPDGALHHNEGFSEGQASQRVDEDVGEGCNRPVGVRFEEESIVPDLPVESFAAAVLYVDRNGGTHGPELVEGGRRTPALTARRSAASSIPRRASAGRLAAPPQIAKARKTSMRQSFPAPGGAGSPLSGYVDNSTSPCAGFCRRVWRAALGFRGLRPGPKGCCP